MNTASASPISTGCLHFAIRMENARKAWTEAIRFLGKLTEAEADIVFAYYLKKKLIRYQAGSYNVKHGACIPALVSFLGAPALNQNAAELLASILGGDGSDYAALDAVRAHLAGSPKLREGALTRISLRDGNALIDDASTRTWDVAAFSFLAIENMDDDDLINAARRVVGQPGQLADDFAQLIAGSTCDLTSPRDHIRHLLKFVTAGEFQA